MATLNIPAELLAVVTALVAAVVALWRAQTTDLKEQIKQLRTERDTAQAEAKATDLELVKKEQLFLEALKAKRDGSSKASEPPSRTATG